MKKKQIHTIKDQQKWCHNYLWVLYADENQLKRFEKATADCDNKMTYMGMPGMTSKSKGVVHIATMPDQVHVLKAKYDPRNMGRVTGSKTCPYYWFDTPDGPPIAFLRGISKALPTVTFLSTYHHETNCFIGIVKARAGKVEQHEIKYAEIMHNSKGVAHA